MVETLKFKRSKQTLLMIYNTPRNIKIEQLHITDSGGIFKGEAQAYIGNFVKLLASISIELYKIRHTQAKLCALLDSLSYNVDNQVDEIVSNIGETPPLLEIILMYHIFGRQLVLLEQPIVSIGKQDSVPN